MIFDISLKEIEKNFEGKIIDRGTGKTLMRFASLVSCDEYSVIFIENEKYASAIEEKKVGLIITNKELELPVSQFITTNPRLTFFSIIQYYLQKEKDGDIDKTANIEKNCVIPESAYIGPNVILGKNVEIGENSVLLGNIWCDDNVRIGENTKIYPNVSIYSDTTIGDNVIIHSGVVIGADGFGFLEEGKDIYKVPQIGGVIIGDNVEIGANTTIDRATLDYTIIEDNVKIDNLVQIAHNVLIKKGARIVAQTGIAGSSVIGENVILAGQAGVADHVEIGNNVVVTAQTGVNSSILKPGVYSGTPAKPMKEHYRILAYEKKLELMWQKIKILEKQLADYEKDS